MHVAQALDVPQAEPTPHVQEAEPAHVAPEGEPVPHDAGAPNPVLYISDSSSSSSSMWKALQEYYGSEGDADSVLPPPGVPLWKRATAAHHSPASQKSGGARVSTPSSAVGDSSGAM
ncbi:hypothetical protein Salat_2528200 [Sesamum alatum]|uniref:Uncharacterized protein n=1 Tax=Sesamum alatum TaxID=300844 RepID=A0AAE1XSY7_9LAMI|nr:hypothetical protein Salat_2528200 [Sesamum alatum]